MHTDLKRYILKKCTSTPTDTVVLTPALPFIKVHISRKIPPTPQFQSLLSQGICMILFLGSSSKL